MNWRSTALFLLHRGIGSNLERDYQDFFQLLRDPDTVAKIHHQRLESILNHARRNISFYRERASVSASTLSDFPIITKKDLRTHFLDLMHPDLRTEYQGKKRNRYSWAEVKTGGSTGKPVSVIHDRDFRDMGRASRLFSQYLCGFPAGEPYFMLWGSMRDINSMKDSPQKRVLNFLLRSQPLNAFQLDDEHCRNYLKLINESSINHMMAYVDAAVYLARYAKRKGVPVRSLKSIMACAGTVTDEDRNLLEEVFQCKVHNKYGSRECTDMVCETADGRLQVFANHIHLEVVDEKGTSLPTGQQGRVLVTLLGNLSFPIIRYEIGDIGTMASVEPLPLMRSIQGRISDMLYAVDGSYVSPVYIRHLIGVVHNPGFINRYRLVQSSGKNYMLEMEIPDSISDNEAKAFYALLNRDLLKIFGPEAQIKFERMSRIPEAPSGKFRYIVNLMLEEKRDA